MSNECRFCGSTSDLYMSACKCITLCMKCAKSMAGKSEVCPVCQTVVTRILKEISVRVPATDGRTYMFGKKLPLVQHGEKVTVKTETMGKKIFQYHTRNEKYEGSIKPQKDSKDFMYYLFMPEKDEFLAVPLDNRYKFEKASSPPNELIHRAGKRLKIGTEKSDRRGKKSSSSDEEESKRDNGWDYEKEFSDDDVDMSGIDNSGRMQRF